MRAPVTARFTTGNAAVAKVPRDAQFDLRHATFDFRIVGGALGKTTVTASMDGKDLNGEPYTTTVELPVEVREATPPVCAGAAPAQGSLNAESPSLRGQGALAKSSISVRGARVHANRRVRDPDVPRSHARRISRRSSPERIS